LEGGDSRGLEAEIASESGRDLTDQPLEGKFPDQKVSALLVLPDFSECDGTWAESMLLLGSLGLDDRG
jgi:hypothetical protein